MKTFKTLILFFALWVSFIFFSSSHAGIFDDIIWNSQPQVQYCDDEWECWLLEWIDLAKGAINDIETERSLSEYIQDLVQYVLTFVTIIAVIYIIYAWFRLMVDPGDDSEKVKRTKNIILYVIVGIIIIWLAWPITLWLFELLWTSWSSGWSDFWPWNPGPSDPVFPDDRVQ